MSIEYEGTTYRSLAEVARAYKIKRRTLYKRIKSGWTLDRAIKETTSKRKNAWEKCKASGCEHPVYFKSNVYCYFHWKQSQKLIPKEDRDDYLTPKEKSIAENLDAHSNETELRDKLLKRFMPLVRKMSLKMSKKYSVDKEDLYQEGCVAIIVSSFVLDESKTRAEQTNFIKNAVFWALKEYVTSFYESVNINKTKFFEENYTDYDLPDEFIEAIDCMDPEQCLIDKEETKRRMSDEELGMALLEEYRDSLSYRDLVIWDAMLTPKNYGKLKEVADILSMTNRNLRYIKNNLVLKFAKHMRENTNEEMV